MEDHHINILDYPILYKQTSIEELKHSLLITTIELEENRARVQEQIKARDDLLNQLKHLLNDAVTERNEARNKYQSLLLEKLLLEQQFHDRRSFRNPQNSGVSSFEDEPVMDCEESIVQSPDQFPAPVKGLPENGRFLEAVMKAGPLLQNLLLAGTLPNWRQPPPAVDAYRIPSAPHHLLSQDYLRNVGGNCFPFNKKRGFCEDSDPSTEIKYQRIVINHDSQYYNNLGV